MKERHYFTKSITFDVDYLFNSSKKESNNTPKSTHKFDNEAVFDVKNLLEK